MDSAAVVILRHGHSLANARKQIVSDARDGVLQENTLSEQGKQQAQVTASELLRWTAERRHERAASASRLYIFASDFSRAVETASILSTAAKEAGVHASLTTTPLLRERYFGVYDKTSIDNYELVWARDGQLTDDALQANADDKVESAQHVQDRAYRCLQQAYESVEQQDGVDNVIVLVAHGDTLQILQTRLQDVDAGLHRQAVKHLDNAGWRVVVP